MWDAALVWVTALVGVRFGMGKKTLFHFLLSLFSKN